MKPLSSLFVSSSFPSTQSTIPALSEPSDRDMNAIFPLVFLTAVLNSYETLKASRLLPDGSLSPGYLWESLERASLLPRKILVFAPMPSIPHYLYPSPSPLRCDAYGDFARSPPLIHKNLMKSDGKVHKNLIRSSPPDIGYKSNLEALLRIGIMSSDKCSVSGKKKTLPILGICQQDVGSVSC